MSGEGERERESEQRERGSVVRRLNGASGRGGGRQTKKKQLESGSLGEEQGARGGGGVRERGKSLDGLRQGTERAARERERPTKETPKVRKRQRGLEEEWSEQRKRRRIGGGRKGRWGAPQQHSHMLHAPGISNSKASHPKTKQTFN